MSRLSTAAILSLLLTVPWSGAVATETPSRGRVTTDRASGPDHRSDVLLLGAQALFPSGGESLPDAGAAAVERLLERLADHGRIVAVRVVGHTDGVGARASNQRLSERRAIAVGRLLERRYPDVPIDVEGAGEDLPVASNATAAGRARNRRVEIHVVSVDAGEEASVRGVPRADE